MSWGNFIPVGKFKGDTVTRRNSYGVALRYELTANLTSWY